MNRIQLGIKLKEARHESRLTQEQLAERFRTDPKRISRLERGIQFPDEEYIFMLAKVSSLDPQNIQHMMREIETLERESTYAVPRRSITNEDIMAKLNQIAVDIEYLKSQSL